MGKLFGYRIIGMFIPIMILFLFVQNASAIRYKSKKPNPVVRDYPWALQIALDGRDNEDTDETDFQGIRFSLKKHNTKYTAFRFNLGFIGHEQCYNDLDLFENDGVVIKFDDGSRFKFTGVNLSAQYLYYPAPDNKFQFFWGAGPRFSVDETDPEVVYVYYDGYYPDLCEAVGCQSSSKVGLGIEASLGAEWFLGRNFSLLAEWGIILQNEWYLFELNNYGSYYNYDDDIETINDGLHLDASRVRLGVSFYF